MSDDPEDTGEKREDVGPGRPPKEHQFGPGNPGRPKGSRNKLGEAFVQALQADFDLHGVATIAKVREEKPDAYVKVIASLLPKEIKIDATSDLNDEQLDAQIRAVLAAIGQLEGGIVVAPAGKATPEGSQAAH